MIRYYEQIGLIPATGRTEAGYRDYAPNDVHRLIFIRSARDLGFSLEEIADLLKLWNDKSRQSADVKRLAQEHMDDLERRMENMRRMADTLRALIKSCAGDERVECPILQTLMTADAKSHPGKREGQCNVVLVVTKWKKPDPLF